MKAFLFQESFPATELERIRSESGCCPDVDSEAFAKYMDINDPLREFRAKFQYPKKKELPIGELSCWSAAFNANQLDNMYVVLILVGKEFFSFNRNFG